MVPPHRHPVGRGVGLEQAGAALQVGEQEGHRALGEGRGVGHAPARRERRRRPVGRHRGGGTRAGAPRQLSPGTAPTSIGLRTNAPPQQAGRRAARPARRRPWRRPARAPGPGPRRPGPRPARGGRRPRSGGPRRGGTTRPARRPPRCWPMGHPPLRAAHWRRAPRPAPPAPTRCRLLWPHPGACQAGPPAARGPLAGPQHSRTSQTPQHRLRPHQHEVPAPIGDQVSCHDPEQLVEPPETDTQSARRAGEDGQLVP